MKKLLALLLALVMIVLCFAGCGENKKVVVAEQGSAGEEVAKTEADFADYQYNPVDKMTKALMEVSAGTADAAVVDYVTSIGSIGEGTDFADLEVSGNGYGAEEYGIAFRKGSDITAKVNEVIKTLKDNGKLNEIATKYKLDALITADSAFEAFKQAETNSDWEYIKNKGELIIGMTIFNPMNYQDENGKLVGFETEFAEAVCAELGIKAKFQEINWDAKETELAAKNIDCIWNGMTITEERAQNMSISIPYMNNKQVMVVKKADK